LEWKTEKNSERNIKIISKSLFAQKKSELDSNLSIRNKNTLGEKFGK